ncbi:MAG: hypothetical protein V1827_02145 [Candidatus Micrarchaeota archaeon]
MAKPPFLDRAIAIVGILVGISGIIFSIYMYSVLSGAVTLVHDTAIAQADSAIGILADTKLIVQGTADSVDSLTSFAKNSSETLNQSADSFDSMGSAITSLATSLNSIPYMPQEATSSLRTAGEDLSGTADQMRDTAGSMGEVGDDALSTASGITALDEDIDKSIASLQDTKKQADDVAGTAQLGLLLGTISIVLLFCLNALSFYRQLKSPEKG